MAAEKDSRMNAFLEIAATKSLDDAIFEFGDAINAREAAALKSLSQDELVALNKINTKILKAAGIVDPKNLPNAWMVGDSC